MANGVWKNRKNEKVLARGETATLNNVTINEMLTFKQRLRGERVDFFFIYFFLFIYSHVHTLFWSFLPPAPPPPPPLSPPHPPRFQAEPVLLLSLILLKRRHKHNKEDKVFLLVEIRIAIQRDS
jgi:hypothetical protein